MPRLRIESFSISVDGFGAGPNQSLDHPLGVGGPALHQWFFETRTYHRMVGKKGGATGTDDDFAARGFANLGAWIIGRNMFGPRRGPWPDEDWKGWWGENPPFHTPVFVLTNQPRASISLQGGTTFHFATDGIDAALELATQAAGQRDIRLGGGVCTLRQYLCRGLVDQIHLAVAPVFLGAGEPLLCDINLPALGYRIAEHVSTPNTTHIVLTRT